jgi:hypothetical protein
MLVAWRPKSVSTAPYAQSLLVEPRKTSLHVAVASVECVSGSRGRWVDAFKPAAFSSSARQVSCRKWKTPGSD